MTNSLKWILPITLVFIYACKPVKKDCSCQAAPACVEGREMKIIPPDLTSTSAAKGTLTELSKVILRLYTQTLDATSKEDDSNSKQTELMEEISDWLGGKDNKSDRNLFEGLSFSDEYGKDDFKVLAKPIRGELFERGFNDSEGRNVYKAVLTYNVEVTNLDKKETVIDTVECPHLMIKTCVYYEY